VHTHLHLLALDLHLLQFAVLDLHLARFRRTGSHLCSLFGLA
jgi:hypothetical protein